MAPSINDYDEYAEPDEDQPEPELSHGTCKRCRRGVYWMLTKNDRLVPVEPATVEKYTLDEDAKSGPSPNNPKQWLYVMNWNAGHRAHFDYCKNNNESKQAPPQKTVEDDLFDETGNNKAKLYRELELLPIARPEVVRAAYQALCETAEADRLKRINAAYEKIMGDL